MARVTIEDCLKVVSNRFELNIIASNRSKELIRGDKPIIEVKNGEKPTVIALREIASGKMSETKLNQLKYAFKAPKN